MAAKTQPAGLGAPRIDPQPKRVTVDVTLKEVSPDSPSAAFVYDPGDLERLRERREQLQNEGRLGADASRLASAKAELSAAQKRLSRATTEVDELNEVIKTLEGETKSSSKAKDSGDDK